jgi:hypothetical protein
MPEDMPDVDQPETDTPIVAQSSTPDEAADKRDNSGQPTREADPAEEAQGTRHTQPGEDAAGWKAASEAGKHDSDDPRP